VRYEAQLGPSRGGFRWRVRPAGSPREAGSLAIRRWAPSAWQSGAIRLSARATVVVRATSTRDARGRSAAEKPICRVRHCFVVGQRMFWLGAARASAGRVECNHRSKPAAISPAAVRLGKDSRSAPVMVLAVTMKGSEVRLPVVPRTSHGAVSNRHFRVEECGQSADAAQRESGTVVRVATVVGVERGSVEVEPQTRSLRRRHARNTAKAQWPCSF